jgi:hypothetical protein
VDATLPVALYLAAARVGRRAGSPARRLGRPVNEAHAAFQPWARNAPQRDQRSAPPDRYERRPAVSGLPHRRRGRRPARHRLLRLPGPARRPVLRALQRRQPRPCAGPCPA